MSLTNEQEKQLENVFKDKLNEQYNRGIHVGVLVVSKVVLDKLNDNSKPLMTRIKEIRKFCELPLNKQNQAENTPEEPSVEAESVSEADFED